MEKIFRKEQLYDDHWLLAYEAVIKDWIAPSEDYIENDPFFKSLKDDEVSFYDTTISKITPIPGTLTSGS